MSVKKSERKLEKGDLAPGFKLRGTDGEKHGLEDFKDFDYILIVFTCNHCPYARSKIDVLNELSEEEDLCVVGVNPNSPSREQDSFEKMVEWVDEGVIRYDFYLEDETQEVAKSYGAVCTPDPFLFQKTEEGFELVYHGRIDDAMNPDENPTKNFIYTALKDLRKGNDPELGFKPSQKCSIKWRK